MKIIVDDYELTTSDSGFKISKRMVGKDGEDAWRPLSYYGYIEHALEAYYEFLIKSKDAESVSDMIKTFHEVRDDIIASVK